MRAVGVGGVLAVGLLAACNDAQTGEASRFVTACSGSGMPSALCECMDENARKILDGALYEKLVQAAEEAKLAREGGSEDGMMDKLPEDLTEEEVGQIGDFLRASRTQCRVD